MRKQMNGAVADAMFYYGTNYGLNYGVSIPTIRQIAKQVEPDHSLALYLYKQQVRELRLAALHIALPSAITKEELPTWAEGVINSEVAEEMAFALLPRVSFFKHIFTMWSSSDNEFLAYAALMGATRNAIIRDIDIIHSIPTIVKQFESSRIIAQGCVAFLAAAYDSDREAAEAVRSIMDKISDSPTANYINEEMSWRMEL